MTLLPGQLPILILQQCGRRAPLPPPSLPPSTRQACPAALAAPSECPYTVVVLCRTTLWTWEPPPTPTVSVLTASVVDLMVSDVIHDPQTCSPHQATQPCALSLHATSSPRSSHGQLRPHVATPPLPPAQPYQATPSLMATTSSMPSLTALFLAHPHLLLGEPISSPCCSLHGRYPDLVPSPAPGGTAALLMVASPLCPWCRPSFLLACSQVSVALPCP